MEGNMRIIDLRSDTVTKPTKEMREAMMQAEVGDDVYDDDPTVKRLEKRAAELMGMEAALFTPSGTMANQLAIMAHTRRGDEIILGRNSHIVEHEVGAAAILSNVSFRVVANEDDMVYGQDIHKAVREDDIHYPRTGLVCLENALSNGKVAGVAVMEGVQEAAKEHGLPVHLDGARIFNAALHLGVEAKRIAGTVDSIMFCLSKGLCAPVGSMLCGSSAFVMKAKKLRKLLGGGMRQVGCLAAPGLIAIDQMVARLGIDHENAKHLARRLSQLPFVTVDTESVHVNMVFFRVADNVCMKSLEAHLSKNGVKTNPAENGMIRFVTHNDITKEDIDTVVDLLEGISLFDE